MLPYLQRPEKDVRVDAIGAVAQLADEQHAEVVKPYIQQAAAGAEETVVRAANKAMQKLEGRTSTGRSIGDFCSSALPTPLPAPGPTMARDACRSRPARAARGPTMIVQPPPAPVHASAMSTARTLLVEGRTSASRRRRPRRRRSI